MVRASTIYGLALTGLLAFLLGRDSVISSAGSRADPFLHASPRVDLPVLPLQGRRIPGGNSSGKVDPPPRGTIVKKGKPSALPFDSGGGVPDRAGDLIAVTGSYGVGTSVLYLIDSRTRQLAVYEARGGSANGRRLYLVGARRIDLDLQLEGFNDRSEYSYRKLRDRFEKVGLPVGEAGPSVVPDSGTEAGGEDRD